MKCMLCGVEEYQPFESTSSFGYPLAYYRCVRCGFIFQSIEESRASNPDFYIETYRKIYQGDPEPTEKDLYVQKSRAEFLIRFLSRQEVRTPKRILDVGASSGILLVAFQSAFGGRTTGVEPGDAYRAYAESQGLDMRPSLEALMTSNESRFDLISMIHVLEHLPDPVGTLQMIREKLLAKGGALLVEVPNFYVHDSYELAHLSCFTPHTLQEALKAAGFRITKLIRHGHPRSRMLNLYLTGLAVPSKKSVGDYTVNPERFVSVKRELGMLYRRLVQKLFPHQAWRPQPAEKAG